jgi:Ca2+-binding RTX toxin-like protein
VDNAGDVVTELVGEGTDTVKSSLNYTLGANVDILTLTGSAAINGTGNDLGNALIGNTGDNTLIGLGGNDALSGGLGADTMIGGLGNDTYTVDNAGDAVTELVGEGTDLVQSAITYTLSANVENLTLTGSSVVNGTGNVLNNILTGNTGANILTGGGGNDTYVVGAGDSIVELDGEGTDLVQSAVTHTLSANVENLTLTGSSAVNGTGNVLNNILTGNTGANILTGGGGNDTYVVGAGDSVVELDGEGTDLVQSAVTYTLSANVENLTLTGSSVVNGTGNVLNNILTGNTGANILTGGGGNDTYVVGAGDSVVELDGEGTDLVQSAITHTLSANVENLTLTGSSAVNGTGNLLNNILTGNTGANVLDGGEGADTLIGSTGSDSLTGGAGNDIFKYNARSDTGDTIRDFSQSGINGADLIDVSAVDANTVSGGVQSFLWGGTKATAHGAWYTESGGTRTILSFDTDGNTGSIEMSLTLTGVGLGLSASDFVL